MAEVICRACSGDMEANRSSQVYVSKRFLITTALEETWRNDEPVLFIGEWCRLYCKRAIWSKMDAEVLPYHWDDRRKLYADYQYLSSFYERLLRDLTYDLNSFHSVDHSLRFWRIVIGPWLGYFSQILFDRWTSIRQAINQYDLTGTIVLAGLEEAQAPNDMSMFTRVILEDRWNHELYANIVRRFSSVPCISQAWTGSECFGNTTQTRSWKKSAKKLVRSCYARIVRRVVSDEDAFLLATYLTARDEVRLCRKLGQVPQFWESVRVDQISSESSQRQWVVTGDSRSEFETCARSLIPQQIPTAYLEGYKSLTEQTKALRWPTRPKFILTSNASISDDLFKLWAAEKIENGTPLIVGQHGGHYGMGLWSFEEDHETAISDRYLSWGWTSEKKPNVKPVGQFRTKKPLFVQRSMKSGALLVTCSMPRLSYCMYSAIVSRQWLDYFDDQCKFVEHLPESIRKVLTVRAYPHDYGWEQSHRWRDRFPDLRLNDGQSSLTRLIGQSRLYISTYNATTYLESFTMNVPTIIYWNPRHWELRDSAMSYFEELKRVAIFHESPQSAANYVEAIWDDIDEWWGNPEVRDVLARFKARYCRLPVNLIDRIDDTLREVIDVPEKVASK